MAMKSEPMDTEAEQNFLTNSDKPSPPGRSSHDTAISHVTSHPMKMTSHPINFLTDQGRPEMMVDPVLEDVIFLPPRTVSGRGHKHVSHEVTEYATYTISHHEAELNSKLLPKKYRCRFCVYKTSYKSDLNRHLRKHGIAPQHCPICNMPFKTTGNLENHMRQTHGDVASSMGVLTSTHPAMCVEGGGLVPPPLMVGALGNVVNFPQGSPDVHLHSPETASHHRQPHHRRRSLTPQEFPSVPQVKLSPAQLSCHLCSFVCSDSELLARHLLVHPGEEEASRTSQSPQADLLLTRLACDICGMILSSVDELQSHRCSCPLPDNPDKFRNGGGSQLYRNCEDSDASSPKNHEVKGVSKGGNSVGLPRPETMDKLGKTIANQSETQTGSNAQLAEGPVHPKIKQPRSMILPHIPSVEDSNNNSQRRIASSSPDRYQCDIADVVYVDDSQDDSLDTPLRGNRDEKQSKNGQSATAAAETTTTATSPHTKPCGPCREPNLQNGGEDETHSVGQHCGRKACSAADTGHSQRTESHMRQHNANRLHPLESDNLLQIVSAHADERTDTHTEHVSQRKRRSEGLLEHNRILGRQNSPPRFVDCFSSEFSVTGSSKRRESIKTTRKHSDISPVISFSKERFHDLQNGPDKGRFRYNLLPVKEEPTSPNSLMNLDLPEAGGLPRTFPADRSGHGLTRSRTSGDCPGFNNGPDQHECLSCAFCEEQFSHRTQLLSHLYNVHRITGKNRPSAKDPKTPSTSGLGFPNITYLSDRHSAGAEKTRLSNFNKTTRQRRSILVSPKSSLAQASATSAASLPVQKQSIHHTDSHSDSHGVDSQSSRRAGRPPDGTFHDTRVLPQPPSSGRYAKLVSDFDEFSVKPYACALCFFRTAQLGELRQHVHNHLTGCNSAPIPETARFQPMEAFHVERSTSPPGPASDFSAEILTVSPAPVSGLASGSPSSLDLRHDLENAQEAGVVYSQDRHMACVVSDSEQGDPMSDDDCDLPNEARAKDAMSVVTTVDESQLREVAVVRKSDDRPGCKDISSLSALRSDVPKITPPVQRDDSTPTIPLIGDSSDDHPGQHFLEPQAGAASLDLSSGGLQTKSASLSSLKETQPDTVQAADSTCSRNPTLETPDLEAPDVVSDRLSAADQSPATVKNAVNKVSLQSRQCPSEWSSTPQSSRQNQRQDAPRWNQQLNARLGTKAKSPKRKRIDRFRFGPKQKPSGYACKPNQNQCAQCGKKFSLGQLLFRHIRCFHGAGSGTGV